MVTPVTKGGTQKLPKNVLIAETYWHNHSLGSSSAAFSDGTISFRFIHSWGEMHFLNFSQTNSVLQNVKAHIRLRLQLWTEPQSSIMNWRRLKNHIHSITRCKRSITTVTSWPTYSALKYCKYQVDINWNFLFVYINGNWEKDYLYVSFLVEFTLKWTSIILAESSKTVKFCYFSQIRQKKERNGSRNQKMHHS
jgi:hypothetical protein